MFDMTPPPIDTPTPAGAAVVGAAVAGVAGRLSGRVPDASVVAVLDRPPDPGASGFDRLERIGTFERVINRLQALQAGEIAGVVDEAEAAMAARVAGHVPGVDPPLGVFDTPGDAVASVVAEVRLELGLTGHTVWNRVGEARRLHDPGLAPTAALARAGVLSRAKTTMLADAAADLDPAQVQRLQDRLLPAAPTQTTGQLGAAIRRFLEGLSDDRARARRRERKDRGRGVAIQPEPDGMATLRVFLPAAAATGIYAVLDQHARGCGAADPRGMDARRVDALVDLVLRDTGLISHATATTTGADGAGVRVPGLAAAAPGTSPFVQNTVRVHIHVTVPLDTLTGAGHDPGELAGHGPIPAADARALAFDPDSVWDRILTDPVSGAALEHGTTRYRPTADLTRFVRARHGTCAHPGCRTPAHRCDIDHVVPFNHDPSTDTNHDTNHDTDTGTGHTGPANTCPLCRSHHRIKHMPGWQVSMRPDGTTVWTTPSGHTYTAPPSPPGPRHAPDTAARRGPSTRALMTDPATRARFHDDVAEAPF